MKTFELLRCGIAAAVLGAGVVAIAGCGGEKTDFPAADETMSVDYQDQNTIWAIAQAACPDAGDLSPIVYWMEQANGIDDPGKLQNGQQLIVPKDC